MASSVLFSVFILGILALKCEFSSAHAPADADSRSSTEILLYQMIGDLNELQNENKIMKEKIEMLEETLESGLESTESELENSAKDLHRCRNLLDTERVAFTATRSSKSSSFGNYATVIFDTVESNVGQGYDAKTGVFTCPFTGYYFFTHSALSTYNGHIETDIVLEGTPKAMIYAESSTPSGNVGSGYDQGSNSVVLYCEAGHRVWVRAHGNRGTNVYPERFSLFSGFLLWTL